MTLLAQRVFYVGTIYLYPLCIDVHPNYRRNFKIIRVQIVIERVENRNTLNDGTINLCTYLLRYQKLEPEEIYTLSTTTREKKTANKLIKNKKKKKKMGNLISDNRV